MSVTAESSLSLLSPDQQKEVRNELVVSYLTLRKLIGISGMLLPFILIFITSRIGTDEAIEPSISSYYYTSSGEIFVVILSTLAVFLFTYTGYDPAENRWTTLAGIGALGVAFFPTSSADVARNAFSVHTARPIVPGFFGLIEWHFLFAALFFGCTAVMSLVYFTQTTAGKPLEIAGKKTPKGHRNRVYVICGWTIIGSILGIGVHFGLVKFAGINLVGDFPIVFLLEFIAVEAFGLSWLTKGQTLWPDKETDERIIVAS